jgi:type VI secretion system secreted protein VgrG
MGTTSPWVQTNRPLSITTPLGPDAVLLVGLQCREAISQLYEYRFDVALPGYKPLAFDSLLGSEVTASLRLPDGKVKYFSGMVNRIRQGERTRIQEKNESVEFLNYAFDVVPRFWLLGRQVRSRIFQQKSIPDILKNVLQGINVKFQIDGANDFQPRDYCVQYRESDFSFASRLMEEEGIFYFFNHSSSGHELVVTNSSSHYPELSPSLIFDEGSGGSRPENRIDRWIKSQEIRSTKYTLWDYCFEMPDKNLEAQKVSLDSVQVGSVTHKLKVAANQAAEIYDFPGGYAQRFDGITQGGGEQAANLQNIFQDNTRTATLRMQAETTPAILIAGSSDCRQMSAGSRFTLDRHYSDNGPYVLTAVDHFAEQALRPGDASQPFRYSNQFVCLPFALPFRPARVTPIPVMHGAQTATVVGPAGQEIFTDKYSRVKVQFHWDREGKNDADSSCWVRVASPWAGKRWGVIHIPRIGQEVVVDFIEGDVDEPIIVGSVYNADNMPPYTLPDGKTRSGIKSRSSLKGSDENYNELRFEDKKGSEQIFVHAEKDLITEVESDETRSIGHDRTTTIQNNETKTVKDGDEKITLEKGDQSLTISMGKQTVTIKGDQSLTLEQGDQSVNIQTGNQSTKITVGKSETEALQSIELKVGGSSVKLDQMGVTIKGMNIKIEGDLSVSVKGLMTQVNGDGMLVLKGGLTMIN